MPESMPPDFRRAGPDDAAAVDGVVQAAYGKWVAVLGRRPMPMTVDYAEAVHEHRIDLLEAGGRLLGLIETTPAPGHLLIVNIAVDPACQHAGLGARLLAHAESLATELGLGELRLFTNGRMLANIAYYQRHGYRIEREETRGPEWSVMHMVKRLDP
jgi:ribosomal protein S18 acetylase RimI-like enzyme